MKTVGAKKLVDFTFRCPECSILWALGTDVTDEDELLPYDESEMNMLNDLLEFGKTECHCDCGCVFKVDVK